MQGRAGFGLVELLIVMGIMAIIGRFTVLNLLSLAAQSDLDATASNLAVYIRDAQIKSINLIDDSDWGVRIYNTNPAEFFLYKIDCLSGASNNLTAITKANLYQDYYKNFKGTLKITNPVITQSKNFIFKRATGELYDDNGVTCGASTATYACGNAANDKVVAFELLSDATKKRTVAVNCYGKATITN